MCVNTATVWSRKAYELHNSVHGKGTAKPRKCVSKMFWADAVAFTVFICSRAVCARDSFQTTPFKSWTAGKPGMGSLCVFGSSYWYDVRRQRFLKLGDRGSPAVMIGYARN